MFDSIEVLVISIVSLFVGAIFGALIMTCSVNDLKQEAVKRNYAEWCVYNTKTGDTEFRWK